MQDMIERDLIEEQRMMRETMTVDISRFKIVKAMFPDAELARAIGQPDVLERIAALGAEPVGGPPQRLADHLRAEIPKWSRVVREANIRL